MIVRSGLVSRSQHTPRRAAWLAASLLALAGLFLISVGAAPASAQSVVSVPANARGMNAAISRAQATLPQFIRRVQSPQPGDGNFAVKIKYPTGSGVRGGLEHIWANEVTVSGNRFSATINNVPEDIPGLRLGQRVTVARSQITDWMYERGGRLHGAYTVRAILPYLPQEQAAELRRRLAPQ